jgi:hypothetical protein
MSHLIALICEVLAAGASLVAAVYWYRSATVAYPSTLRGFAMVGGAVDIGVNPLLDAVRRGARLNKMAAAWSAVAAFMAAISILFQAFP